MVIDVLVPDGTDNERWGCTQFIQNFKERYEHKHSTILNRIMILMYGKSFQIW